MTDSVGARVLTGTSAQLAGKAVTVVAGLVSIRILTTYLGPDGFGIYVTATAFLALVAIVADGGLSLLTVNELSRPHPDPRGYITVMVRGRVALSVAIAGLGVVVAWVLFHDRFDVLFSITILLLFLPPLSLAALSGSVLQSRSLLPRVAMVEAIARITAVSGLVVVTRTDLGLRGCLAVVAGGWVLHSVLLLVAVPVDVRPHLRQIGGAGAGFAGMLRRSLPLGAAALVNGVYFRVDAVMVALLAGVQVAGQYGVAYRGLELLLLAPSAFGAALLPALVRASSQVDTLQAMMGRAIQFVMVAMTPLVAVVWIAAPVLVGLLGGSQFSGSVQLLRILAIAAWFSSFDIVLGLGIVVAGVQGRLLWINVGALALNIVGNVLLIPRIGAAGAAVMTAACEAAVLVAATLALRRVAGVRVSPPRTGRVTVAIVVLFGSTAVLADTVPWLLAICACLCLYALLLVGLRGVVREDIPGWQRGRVLA